MGFFTFERVRRSVMFNHAYDDSMVLDIQTFFLNTNLVS